MAKLILKYEASVLKELKLLKPLLTIGRAPGNDVVIDNLAVSGQHAKLVVEDGRFLVEDLNSLNGTFINNQRIRRSALKDGDEIVIGKHTLQFREEPGSNLPMVGAMGWQSTQEDPGGSVQTVVLDTKKRREFLAKATSVATEGSSADAHEKIGCLVVLKGKTSQPEYILNNRICMIGKDPRASVRLKGWFAPKVAAIITRRGRSHFDIAPSERGKTTLVNSEPLKGPQELNEGDQIHIGKVQMRFYYRE